MSNASDIAFFPAQANVLSGLEKLRLIHHGHRMSFALRDCSIYPQKESLACMYAFIWTKEVDKQCARTLLSMHDLPEPNSSATVYIRCLFLALEGLEIGSHRRSSTAKGAAR